MEIYKKLLNKMIGNMDYEEFDNKYCKIDKKYEEYEYANISLHYKFNEDFIDGKPTEYEYNSNKILYYLLNDKKNVLFNEIDDNNDNNDDYDDDYNEEEDNKYKRKRMITDYEIKKLYDIKECENDIIEYENSITVVRKFYEEVINKIESKQPKNVLIFGHKYSGKSKLAYYLYNYYKKSNNVSLYDKSISYHINKWKRNILIALNKLIGEDDYFNADLVILISDIDENNSKTFQIKRCPLIFIIPPFNDDEIKLLYHINYNDPDEKTKLFDHYKK